MANSCFGSPATAAWGARVAADTSLIVADPSGFGGAMGELISRGLSGAPRDLFLLPLEPRTLVLEAAFLSLQQQSQSHDILLRGYDTVALGNLTINGESQRDVERRLSHDEMAAVFQDLTLTADRTFFRSYRDLDAFATQYGFRPPRAKVVTPLDVRVPSPQSDVITASDHITVWAVGCSSALLAAFQSAVFDLRSPIQVIDREGCDAATLIQQSKVVVCLSDDPGTVYALAKYKRPLCAPVCGGNEVVENLYEFRAWNRIDIVNAILLARNGTASSVRSGNERLTIPLPVQRSWTVERAPLVSIVMPTYSRPNTLRLALTRLRDQTYPNIEVAVVNNAGTAVDDVVADFPHVRLINRTENTGNATRPRNDGIEATSGRYIALLDDDDVFFPNHISHMVDALETSGADAAYSDFFVRFVERHSDGVETVWGWDLQKPAGITTYELLVNNRLGYLTVFMRRSLVDKIGLFSEEVLGGEEVEYWLRIAQVTDFVHVPQPTTAYTVVRNWQGQLSEKSHALYASGYEKVYERYPAPGLPLIAQLRAAHVATLRSTSTPPPLQPRYTVGAQ